MPICLLKTNSTSDQVCNRGKTGKLSTSNETRPNQWQTEMMRQTFYAKYCNYFRYKIGLYLSSRKMEWKREKAQTSKEKQKTKKIRKQETLLHRHTLYTFGQQRIVTANRLTDKTSHHMRYSIKSLNKRMDSEFSGRITLRARIFFVFRFVISNYTMYVCMLWGKLPK